MKELVSIIVPVYNVEKYIDKCLNSLVNQSYKNIEIIVVNDGSKDNSQQIIDEYKKNYSKLIKSFIKKNGGLSDARNYGIEKSSGEYLAFIDSDDYIDKDYVKDLYNSIKKNNSDIAVCGVVDEYNELQKKKVYKNYIPEKCGNILDDPRQLFNRASACNKLFKKSLFKDKSMRFEKGKIYEDLCLIPKICLKADRISYVDKPLYNYVIRGGSIMIGANLEKNLDIIFVFDSIINYFKKENVYCKLEKEIEYLAIEHIMVATVLRVISISKVSKIKENIKVYGDYINDNFPNYMNNPYLDKLTKNRQLALKLISKKHYIILKILDKIRN